jgi:hypothetical protein
MGKSGFSFEGSGRIDRVEIITTKKGGEIITLVVQVEGQYPQLVPIKFFGRVAELAREFGAGDIVEVTGRLGGRDWNGKVYGDIVGETLERAGDHSAQPQQEQSADDSIPF